MNISENPNSIIEAIIKFCDELKEFFSLRTWFLNFIHYKPPSIEIDWIPTIRLKKQGSTLFGEIFISLNNTGKKKYLFTSTILISKAHTNLESKFTLLESDGKKKLRLKLGSLDNFEGQLGFTHKNDTYPNIFFDHLLPGIYDVGVCFVDRATGIYKNGSFMITEADISWLNSIEADISFEII
ncbi:MAG TPA: hypothetical protein VK668_20300 [Mucilaginibacter sp.]|nr:hypothetical protein [Mucilaginibacter sp.]